MTSPPTWNRHRSTRIRAGQSAYPSLLSRMVFNVVLPWILALVILVVLPIALALFAEDGPRSDDPPDAGEEPELLPLAALRVPLDNRCHADIMAI